MTSPDRPAETGATPRPSLVVHHHDAVATVVMDRPPVNAIEPIMIERFIEVIEELGQDASVRCIVIQGAGRFFSAGADLAVMRDLTTDNQAKMQRFVIVQRRLELVKKPVIAAMNGHALGGGAVLALACDLRMIASSATFGFPELTLGILPGGGVSQRLPILLGTHRAKLMMIEGQRLSADDALAAGVVDIVVPDAEFDEAVAAKAAAWASKPTIAIGFLKQAVDAGRLLDIDDALDVEQAAITAVTQTRDAAEGLQAFLDKRPPHYLGR